jgi:hypothetical protein
MRTEDWGPEWSRFGRLEFFPYPIEAHDYTPKSDQSQSRKNSDHFNENWELGGRSEQVRSAGVLSLSNKHAIYPPKSDQSQGRKNSAHSNENSGLGGQSGAVVGGWSSFPIQYKHMWHDYTPKPDQSQGKNSSRVWQALLTLFYTRGLGIDVLHVMVPEPYRFSLCFFITGTVI